MVDIAEVKIAVLQCALGIKSLEDKELFERLEQFWISAYARGRGIDDPEQPMLKGPGGQLIGHSQSDARAAHGKD